MKPPPTPIPRAEFHCLLKLLSEKADDPEILKLERATFYGREFVPVEYVPASRGVLHDDQRPEIRGVRGVRQHLTDDPKEP